MGIALAIIMFLPTIIAIIKRKLSTNAIFVVNAIPIVGWIIALVWALKEDRTDQVQIPFSFKHYFIPAIFFGFTALGMVMTSFLSIILN